MGKTLEQELAINRLLRKNFLKPLSSRCHDLPASFNVPDLGGCFIDVLVRMDCYIRVFQSNQASAEASFFRDRPVNIRSCVRGISFGTFMILGAILSHGLANNGDSFLLDKDAAILIANGRQLRVESIMRQFRKVLYARTQFHFYAKPMRCIG